MFGSSNAQLPEHCLPSKDFLYSVSLTFGSCIPTPLALISTVLGVLSILSWLFAQVPQIIKNFNLRSTSGLSAFFLGEWLLGDVSNLLGSLFTGQATWQVVLALYYCCVDCVLCAQWIWYEYLKHGRQVRRVRWWTRSRAARDDEAAASGMKPATPAVKVNGVPVEVPKSKPIASRGKIPGPGFSPTGTPLGTPSEGGSSWMPSSIFSRPQFTSVSSADTTLANSSPASTTSNRPIIRVPRPESPTPSPRTLLYMSLLLCVVARASPTHTASYTLHGERSVIITENPTATQLVGTVFSWLSTLLYLVSRLPQLLHNASRRSTEGLSPTLFLAAFFGNLFYSSSMLTNPMLWHDMPPHGGRGWADEHGNDRLAWTSRAAPFFLGAAGVLLLDALVGLQFLWYAKQHDASAGGSSNDDGGNYAAVLVVEAEGVRGAGRWRHVSGWMRGWVPAASAPWRRRSDSSASYASGSGCAADEHADGGAGARETDRLLGRAGLGNAGAGTRPGKHDRAEPRQQQTYGTSNLR